MKARRVLALFCAAAASGSAADDVTMRAMHDELARSMQKLQLENLQKPYFIAYRSVETLQCDVEASFGALIGGNCEQKPEDRHPSRNLAVDVRVGDYARDNSNFFAPRLVTAGVARPLRTGGLVVPLDDNYDEIRRQLWLATDSGYKNALDLFAKKKATLENRTRTADAPDLSHEPVVTVTGTPAPFEWNAAAMEALAKRLSLLFRDSPEIDSSLIRITATRWITRFVNSEGTSYVRPASFVTVLINGETQATDGMPLTDYDSIDAHAVKDLPPEAALASRVKQLAARLTRERHAEMVERYTGPVLFEPAAAGELALQALGAAFTGTPRVVVDDLRFERAYNSNGGFDEKIGTRVLPDFLSLTDNPAATDYRGQPLYGGYEVDDDGVKSGPTLLVEKGILKTLLHTRALIPGTAHSTGSRRGSGPMPSNLFFTADKSMPMDQLKAELLRMAKQRGNDYGIVIRRMASPSLELQTGRSRNMIVTAGGGPGSIDVSAPLEAYKLFPDGRMEPVRNLTIDGLTFGAFKDIAAVCDAPAVYSAPVRMAIRGPVLAAAFAVSGGPDAASVAIPALLFDDMALRRPRGEVPNLPFTTNPYFSK